MKGLLNRETTDDLGGPVLHAGLLPTFKTTGAVPCNWDTPKMPPHISKRPLEGIFARDVESSAHPRQTQETEEGGSPLTGKLRMMPRSKTGKIWTLFPGNGANNELVNLLGALNFDSWVTTPTSYAAKIQPGFPFAAEPGFLGRKEWRGPCTPSPREAKG